MTSRSAVRAVAGIAVSVVALWLVLSSVDVGRTGEVLGSAAPAWIAVMGGFLAIDVLLRAVRWQRLIGPIRHVGFLPTLGYLLVGYLANNVLPARIGELVRCHYLGDREGLSRTTALGTVVVERIVDVAVVVAIAAFAIIVLSVRGLVANAVLVGVAVVVLLGVALAIGVAAHRLPGAERAARFAGRWPKIGEMAGRLRDGLAVAGRPRTLFEALALSVLAWGATLLAFAAAGQSIGIELTIGQASLLASGVALAGAIPAGPASLGTFEAAAVLIGRSLGVPADSALAIGLLVHATILLTTTVGGGVALARLGWRRDPSMGEQQAARTTAAPEQVDVVSRGSGT
jgi:glycosyltransferase 2 family protein